MIQDFLDIQYSNDNKLKCVDISLGDSYPASDNFKTHAMKMYSK